MRLALFIHTHSPTATIIDLFPANQLSDNPKMSPVRLSWANGFYSGVISDQNPYLASRVLLSLDNAVPVDTSVFVGLLTPFMVAKAILEAGGTQVVWDPEASRFRNVATAKDGDDTWELPALSLWVNEHDVINATLDAPDEATAQRRAKKMVTETMAESPEHAAELVKFFTGGCVVRKVSSGKVPPHISVKSLATLSESKQEILVKAKAPTKRELKKAENAANKTAE